MMQSAKTQFNIDVTGQTITIMATSTCHQYIGAVPFISIEKMLITNWQYNREADENRVVEITKKRKFLVTFPFKEELIWSPLGQS